MDRENVPKPDDGESAAGHDDEVAEVVAKGHTGQYGKWSVQLYGVSPIEVGFQEGWEGVP